MCFQVPLHLDNLITDSKLRAGAPDWRFEGCASGYEGFSRNFSDTGCIRFTGSGAATYETVCEKAGDYSLRYFLYDRGPVKRADMVILINGEKRLTVPLTPRGWWSEYATAPVSIPAGARVTVRMEVEDNAQELIEIDRTFELSGTETNMCGPNDICVDLDEVYLVRVPYAIPEPFETSECVSSLARREDGTYYMQVHGKPFLCRLAHACDLHVMDMRKRVQKIKEAGFNTFSCDMEWKECQTAPDQSDLEDINFEKIDEAIAIAEELDMYICFGFSGAGNCGIMKCAPQYVWNDHSLHARHPQTGACFQKSNAKDGSDRMCVAEYGNERLLELEGNVVKQLLKHIAKVDTHKRIILFKIENEPLESIYACDGMEQQHVAKHINAIAKLVKFSDHPMLTYTNHGFGNAAHFLYNTPYVDFNGTDPYTDNLSAINKILQDSFNSRIACLAENGGYANSSAQMAAAYERNGFVAPYPIGPDTYWDRPGMYGYDFEQDDYVILPLTRRITAINQGCAKIASPLARQPYLCKASFNTGNEGMVADYTATKRLGDIEVTVKNYPGEDAVAIAVTEGNRLYVTADKNCLIKVDCCVKTATRGYYEDEAWSSIGEADAEQEWFVCPASEALCLVW